MYLNFILLYRELIWRRVPELWHFVRIAAPLLNQVPVHCLQYLPFYILSTPMYPYSQHWKVESRANIWTTYFSFQLSTGATPTSWWASTCRLSWLTCCGSIWIYQSQRNLHHQATFHNLFAFWRGFSSLFWDITPCKCKLGIHRIPIQMAG